MTRMTKQWVQKAEVDFDGVLMARRSRKRGRHDLIAYHSQQCVEKYLKAILQEAGQKVPRTHNLVELLSLALAVQPLWEDLHRDFKWLSDFAVEVRYPGVWTSSAEGKRAYEICVLFRSLVRSSLGVR